MHKIPQGGTTLRQNPQPVELSGKTTRHHATRPTSPPALLTAEQAARDVYGVSERTFHAMRAKGLIPPAVELGPRLLRWHRSELEAAIAGLPRLEAPRPVPEQLSLAKAVHLTAGATAATA